ncbi:hypothetical protein I553_2752, partial [Mycobacterium xenopi 4042]
RDAHHRGQRGEFLVFGQLSVSRRVSSSMIFSKFLTLLP